MNAQFSMLNIEAPLLPDSVFIIWHSTFQGVLTSTFDIHH